jgi:hypothetical protein
MNRCSFANWTGSKRDCDILGVLSTGTGEQELTLKYGGIRGVPGVHMIRRLHGRCAAS